MLFKTAKNGMKKLNPQKHRRRSLKMLEMQQKWQEKITSKKQRDSLKCSKYSKNGMGKKSQKNLRGVMAHWYSPF